MRRRGMQSDKCNMENAKWWRCVVRCGVEERLEDEEELFEWMR
jgi:hypothetical protein